MVFRLIDEGTHSSTISFALDSPQTHCVPSLVALKTPAFAVNSLHFPSFNSVYSTVNLFAFDSLKPTAFSSLFALKLPAFPVLQYSLC